MKVMKFGGTSVGSVNSILSVKKIVESAGEPVIVVVSALGGITDQLISTSRMAAMGDAAYEGIPGNSSPPRRDGAGSDSCRRDSDPVALSGE